MKEDYYTDWCQTMHITEFESELDRGQEDLLKDNINIPGEDIELQHYMD